jgi:hypothetical protein
MALPNSDTTPCNEDSWPDQFDPEAAAVPPGSGDESEHVAQGETDTGLAKSHQHTEGAAMQAVLKALNRKRLSSGKVYHEETRDDDPVPEQVSHNRVRFCQAYT